jgi:type I restriction-modification system DNA methylase subunit
LDFKAQESAYRSPGYQESQVRQDFIDKFSTALGWDVTHTVQKNPYQQEVHIENKVHMAGSQRRADYAFFLAPNFRDPKFFVEAKKPSRNLANPDDYYQTIRYGWNAGTPIAVLTDFEEFHILDCRYKPDIGDALNRKLKYFHYSEYADEEKFKEIFFLFGREAIANGSIEKYAADLPKPRGKASQGGVFKGVYKSVDEAFLEQLDEYRNVLAKAFKKENQELDGEELTEAVQRTLDRLVFIRFLEDKGIEEPVIIDLGDKQNAWKAFIALCKRLEPKYNGLIFKPHRILDGDRFNSPDDKAFAHICTDLAGPSSPYDFDKIPISILGSIYERFLGKVVHATAKQVKVEEKPEVRKAGGVYYTPEYIVRYIVTETIGKLIEGKTPGEIAKMAFADIACGSGSFLIEVYSQLLSYHERWYNEHPEKAGKEDTFERDGHIHLSLKKKKEILTNNIYGVDIDYQATEVTQLSLYLKLLEDVTNSETHQLGLFKESILPNLNNNIVCGNSLIGTDIHEGDLFGDKAAIDALKPMNFEDAFPKIMKRGGFDAVVGNPPYLKITENNVSKIILEYYGKRFKSIHGGSSKNLFQLFIEKVLELKPNSFSYIVPEAILTTGSNGIIREMMLNAMSLKNLVVFDSFVFQDATIGSSIFVMSKKGNSEEIHVQKLNSEGDVSVVKRLVLKANESVWDTSSSNDNQVVFDKMYSKSSEMKELVEMSKGMVVQDRKKHLRPIPKKNDLPFVLGNSLNRYELNYKQYARYSELTIIGGTKLLTRHTTIPRLLIRRTGNIICATYSEKPELVESTVYILTSISSNLKYLLGVLNSRALTFYLRQKLLTNIQGFPQVLMGQLNQLPVPAIDLSNSRDKSTHDHIVKLVEQMLEAKQKLAIAKTDAEKNRLEHLCTSLDRQIDEAVYELYGLTEEEIKIVEGK